MNGDMSWMYQTEISFLHQKLNANFGKFNFLGEDGRKVQKFPDQQNSLA